MTKKKNTESELKTSPMSKITCNEISEISTLTNNSSIKFEYSRNVIQGLLSDYVKEKIYPRMKFLPSEPKVRESICRSSIFPKGNIILPDSVSQSAFVKNYSKKIPSIFTNLRKASETNVTNQMKGKIYYYISNSKLGP